MFEDVFLVPLVVVFYCGGLHEEGFLEGFIVACFTEACFTEVRLLAA